MTMQPVTSRYFNHVVLPYDYDPDAQCPRWIQFLDEVLPTETHDDHRQQVLQEFMGYSLTRDCRYEKMLILTGNGRNGKSTVLGAWEAMLGRENVRHLPYTQLGAEFRLIEIENALANFSNDLPHLGKTDEGILKQLITGEPINVNRKHKTPVEINPFAKLVVACNTLPSLIDPTLGLWRRLIVLPFNVVIPLEKVDVTLSTQLTQELPGILNWAIRGLKRLREQGRFSECFVSAAALTKHQEDSDSVRTFMAECCHADPTGKNCVIGQPLYEVYDYYCRMTGRKSVGRTEFGRRLKAMGYVYERVSISPYQPRPRAYRGLELTSEGNEWATRYLNHHRSEFGPGWSSVVVQADSEDEADE